MFVADSREERRVCHYSSCRSARRIPDEYRVLLTRDQAMRDGYEISEDCCYAKQFIALERDKLDSLCMERGLSYRVVFDVIKVASPLGVWIIKPQGERGTFALLHGNGKFASPGKHDEIPGYHFHCCFNRKLSYFFGEIAEHDDWRMKNEVLHPYKEQRNPYKYGSKKHQKFERNQKRRRDSYGVHLVLNMLDAISEENRRKELCFNV